MKPKSITYLASGILLIAICLMQRFAKAAVPQPHVLAYWRFEDGEPGHWLVATLGNRRLPFNVTQDASGNGNALRTFNTNPVSYPPDTSPEFSEDVAADTVGQFPNRRSIHLNGKQYLYTSRTSLDLPSHKSFTIEGMFKLAVLPMDYDGKSQVIVCKINSPATQPTTQLSIQRTDQLTTATSQRTGSTQPATQATTRASTQEDLPMPTELPTDHPQLPIEFFIGGKNSRFENRLAVALVDTNKHTHVLASRNTIYSRKWYAFAVVSDGNQASLYLSDLNNAGYEPQSTTRLGPGLMDGKGIWSVGCGLIDDQHDNWFQGNIDEIRISAGEWDQKDFIAAQSRAVSARTGPTRPGSVSQVTPEPTIKGLADPSVLKVGSTYYLYGTRDQGGFPVYKSNDLQIWSRGAVVFNKTAKMWGESRFWAPSVISYKGKYYLFYSALGPLHDSGNRHSHRICIAVSNSPDGPFVDFISPLPLNGKAAIDPEAFVDKDGKVYLYFVADCSENVISQIYAIRMNDDLTGTVGEPVLCTQPSQVWEGTLWNEGPAVFRTGDIYVLMYSAQWWHGADYGVGFATSRSPLGPWTKDPDNPILQHYRRLRGTGGSCAAPSPDGKGMLIFFHAQGPPESMRRDTYFDRLAIEPDSRLGVDLHVEPWVMPQEPGSTGRR